MRFLLPLLLATPAVAVQLAVPRPELCAASTQVVVADVTSTEVNWAAGDEGGLETRVWLTTHKTVRGHDDANLELVFPGGEKDGLMHWVEHVPQFDMDARYLLFLAPHPEKGLQVLGGELGAVRIATKPDEKGESLAKALRSLGDCRGN